MGDNWQRRIPVLYALAEAPPSLVNAYVQSVMAITQAAFQSQLAPLDHDPDFIYYGALFGWGGPPDFQPRIRKMCTTDRKVTDVAVQQLIDHIQGNRAKRRRDPSVAETMGRAFLGLYQRAWRVPGDPPAEEAADAAADGFAGPVADPAIEARISLLCRRSSIRFRRVESENKELGGAGSVVHFRNDLTVPRS